MIERKRALKTPKRKQAPVQPKAEEEDDDLLCNDKLPESVFLPKENATRFIIEANPDRSYTITRSNGPRSLLDHDDSTVRKYILPTRFVSPRFVRDPQKFISDSPPVVLSATVLPFADGYTSESDICSDTETLEPDDTLEITVPDNFDGDDFYVDETMSQEGLDELIDSYFVDLPGQQKITSFFPQVARPLRAEPVCKK